MQESIQFIANYNDWKVIKKLNIDEKVPPLDIVDFLASVSISFDSKIESNLRKILDLKQIDLAIDEIVKEKVKKEEEFAKILKEIASTKITKIINEIIPKDLENKEKDKLKIYLKVYANKKALLNAGLLIDYTKVPIPANKGKI